MLSALLWIIRIPFKIAAFAIKIVLGIILMPLKMLAFALLVRVLLFLGLIAAVAAVIYFVVIR